MTTLNARANQAWRAWAEEMDGWPADSERDVFEEAWELGYKARQDEEVESVGTISRRIAGHLGITLPEEGSDD